jgi:hypothetical protein
VASVEEADLDETVLLDVDLDALCFVPLQTVAKLAVYGDFVS